MTTFPEPEGTPGASPAGPSVRRRAIAIAAAVVVLGALITVLVWPHPAAWHPQALPTPTPTTSATPTSTPTPTPTPTPKPTRTVVPIPHQVVAAAAPVAFHFSGPGVDIRAQVCGMPNIRPLDPPGEQHHTVCWVEQGFGVAPSTTSATTYVLGHAWGQDDREVLNQLSARAMTEVLKTSPVRVNGVDIYPVHNLDHDKLTLRTTNGTLNYTVADVYAVSKDQAGFIHSLMDEHIAHRVVIITCGELSHHDYNYNIIVDAYLTSSIAAKAVTAA
jgi:hypothetical protein